MKKQFIKYRNVILGLLFYSIGVILMVRVNLGLAPWDVFSQGLSRTLGISLGNSTFIIGAIVLLISGILRQHIGIATLFDLFLVSVFTDIFDFLFPPMVEFYILIKIFIFIIGLLLCGYGCFLYIPQGIGCGPRDGLLLGLSRKFNISVSIIGISLESFALICGFYLGGTVGLGTIFVTFLKGPILEMYFKLNKIDLAGIRHRHLIEEFNLIKRYVKCSVYNFKKGRV